MATLAPTVPDATRSAVTRVVSAAGTAVLGEQLTVPALGTAGGTIVLALDNAGTVRAAALATESNTALSARSTALALSRLLVGHSPNGMTAESLNRVIAENPAFAVLVDAVAEAQAQGVALSTHARSVETARMLMAELEPVLRTTVPPAPRAQPLRVRDPRLDPSQYPYRFFQDSRDVVFGPGLGVNNDMPIAWQLQYETAQGMLTVDELIAPGERLSVGASSGTLRVSQQANTRFHTISNLATGSLELVFSFVPTSRCISTTVKAAVDKVIAQLGDPPLDRNLVELALDRILTASAVLEVVETCSHVEVAALAAILNKFTLPFYVADVAWRGFTLAQTTMYAWRYWSPEPPIRELGICLDRSGAVSACAGKMEFGSDLVYLEVCARVTPDDLGFKATDVQGRTTLPPRDLLWSSLAAPDQIDLDGLGNVTAKAEVISAVNVTDPATDVSARYGLVVTRGRSILPTSVADRELISGDIKKFHLADQDGKLFVSAPGGAWSISDTSKALLLPALQCDNPSAACINVLGGYAGEVTLTYQPPCGPSVSAVLKVVDNDPQLTLQATCDWVSYPPIYHGHWRRITVSGVGPYRKELKIGSIDQAQASMPEFWVAKGWPRFYDDFQTTNPRTGGICGPGGTWTPLGIERNTNVDGGYCRAGSGDTLKSAGGMTIEHGLVGWDRSFKRWLTGDGYSTPEARTYWVFAERWPNANTSPRKHFGVTAVTCPALSPPAS